MKRFSFILFVLVCLAAPGLSSLDLELMGGFGNVQFDGERTSALSAGDGEEFEPRYFPLILARLSGELFGFGYNAGFEREPLLRNRLFANLRVNLDYFYLEAGPFIGVANSQKLPFNPGISAAVGFMVPGIVFADLKGSSTLAVIPMEKTGNYSQYSGDAAVGFWVPYAVCSLNMGVKNFSLREQVNFLIEDELARYFFRADVYTKNVPYTLRVDLGLQNLSRSYTALEVSGTEIITTSKTDSFKYCYFGLEGTYTINPAFKIMLGGEFPVYSWGTRPMKDPPRGTALFRAWAGVVWTLPGGGTAGQSEG